MRQTVGIILLACMFAGAPFGCKQLERGRQLGAYVNVQGISNQYQRLTDAGQHPDLGAIVASVNGGKDPWGHPFLYNRQPDSNGGFDYLVVCVGHDGELDVGVITDYYDASFRWVGDNPNSDIVFRNGESLRDAGKDPIHQPKPPAPLSSMSECHFDLRSGDDCVGLLNGLDAIGRLVTTAPVTPWAEAAPPGLPPM